MTDDVQLCLATPPLRDAAGFLPGLDAALSAHGVTSLLVRLEPMDEAAAVKLLRKLAAPAQAAGVAVLVEGAPELALAAGLDGAHGPPSERLAKEAVRKLSPDYIVGASVGDSRDVAMRIGETGVDYLLFETPDSARRLEEVGWWAELFNTPCVAFAEDLDFLTEIAAAGADFVMLSDCVWNDPRGPAAAVADARARLGAIERAPR